MLFNSFEFLIFLPLVFIFYWFLFDPHYSVLNGLRFGSIKFSSQFFLRIQNFYVLIVSYIFYGWWDWRFLILIAFTSGFSFVMGRIIGQYIYRNNKRYAKGFNIFNIIVNLLVLAIFKYYNFFVDSFIDLLSPIYSTESKGVFFTLNIALPVGISFYTFQALSYTIDVYKGKIKASEDWVSFFAYVSFFPQLVAGPIERATNLLPQFSKERVFSYPMAVIGLRQILWGFFKKLIIADNCAAIADYMFDNYQLLPASSLWLGAFCFTFQIYGDFSGYSDIAIGTAKLFGINLMNNFNFPYFSRDIAEFWRRWHISLTTWFRDYIYIPLGGSRGTKLLSMRNTMIIFLISGLWHGANWTFVLWGGYHGLLFLPLLLMGKNRRFTNQVAEGQILPTIKDCFQMGLTFFMVLIGWVIFRAESFSQMIGYLKGMFGSDLFVLPKGSGVAGVYIYPLIVIFLLIEWIFRSSSHVLDISKLRTPLRYFIYIFVLILLLLFSADKAATFVYFQF